MHRYGMEGRGWIGRHRFMERAFLTMKTSRLRVRPVHVYSEDHVRAHVFLCMLAYYVEWHMRRGPGPDLVRGRRPRGRPGVGEFTRGACRVLGPREGQGRHQAHP